MKKGILLVSLISAVMSLGLLSSCGETTSQSSNTTSGGSSSEDTTINEDDGPNFDTSTLVDDVEYDDDGNIIYDGVQVKMWSIVGSPDDVVFKQLIQKFNKEYIGQINLNVIYQGHFDYYSALDTTWANDFDSVPDVCFMHNEKTTEYENKGYLYPLDYSSNGGETIADKSNTNLDFDQIYDNIERVTLFKNHRFAVNVDAHGFITSIRQDIIKKNGLGFDDNTRYIPQSRAEYQSLLEGLRAKAVDGTLLTRDIRKGNNHAWKTANANTFFPEYNQSTDPDGLGALYANGGNMCNSDGTQVTFHENEGFQTYITDQVNRWNNKLMGAPGTNTESFGAGNVVMFAEGPWWIGQTYDPQFNNSDLTTAGSLGVTEEDASDPVYSRPLVASHPDSWWTLPENMSGEHGNRWYGNGHAISITRHVTSMTKASAIMEFIKWFTQGQDSEGNYNLSTWTTGGHLPAWKNVYDSEGYQALKATNVTLQALGDPNDIIAMEGLAYESTIFSGLESSISSVQAQLATSAGCTVEQALQILEETAASTQAALESLIYD